jgi:glycosyltransferase involved in cell wall biosynthesis
VEIERAFGLAAAHAAAGTNRPLRVALITETFLPKIDGIVTRLCHTIRHLRALGHSVLVVAPEGVREFEGVPVHGVPGFSFPIYPELKLALPRPSIGAALEAFQPDLVHAVNPAVLGLSAFFFTEQHGIPLVVSYHTHLPKYLRYYGLAGLEGLLWWCIRESYNRADLNLATSSAMQGELEGKGIHRVRLWRRGVDTELFHPSRASTAMRARLTAGHAGSRLLLYVGRLSAEKEVERCSEVLAAMPGLRLALVGDGPHRQKLEQHFAGTPTHFAGFLQGEELASAFASADAFLLPSQTETLGLVLLESMAAGCPVVAPRAGGIADIVEDGVTGHLYNPSEVNGAAEAVRRLLSDIDHRDRLARLARADAELWSWSAATGELDGYYAEILNREAPMRDRIRAHRAHGISASVICRQLAISKQTYRRHRRKLTRATTSSVA